MKFRERWRQRVIVFVVFALLIIIASTACLMTDKFFSASPIPMVSDYITKSAIKIPGTTASDAFITRSGTSLLLNGRPFRFSGVNIYWLGLQEISGVSYPSSFNVDDVLATASFMGATVVRSHTLGISVGCDLCVEPALGIFNTVALQHIDYAIASARKHHIRLIIPLVDNWYYYHGGKHTFADWRNTDEQAFYSNSQVLGDFEQYISALFNHVNTYTGIAYKDDPTILAWETGNELSAPVDWVQTIAGYIKKVDSHHLLMDGNYEQADQFSNFSADLHIDAIDLYTGHYYPPTITALKKEFDQVNVANKVFVVGEYDWNTNTGDSLRNFLLAIEQSGAAGDMYWSLLPHDDAHGFVENKEHYTLHYPGDTPDMYSRVALIRAHAYTMQGMDVPSKLMPGTPSITTVHGNNIAWRGAFGAATYTIERSTQGTHGPWTVICDRCTTDMNTPWVDKTQPDGSVWYRIKAYSVSGVSGPYSMVSRR